MTLSNEHSQSEIITESNQYCEDLFEKFPKHIHWFKTISHALQKHEQKQLNIPYYFSLNNEVFLFLPVLSKHTHKSFKDFWIGPYKIIKVISPVCYKVQNLNNPKDFNTFYASRLNKKFQFCCQKREKPWWVILEVIASAKGSPLQGYIYTQQ